MDVLSEQNVLVAPQMDFLSLAVAMDFAGNGSRRVPRHVALCFSVLFRVFRIVLGRPHYYVT